MESKLTNNIIHARENEQDYLFKYDDNTKTIVANLNGYAIIPVEEYDRLLKNQKD